MSFEFPCVQVVTSLAISCEWIVNCLAVSCVCISKCFPVTKGFPFVLVPLCVQTQLGDVSITSVSLMFFTSALLCFSAVGRCCLLSITVVVCLQKFSESLSSIFAPKPSLSARLEAAVLRLTVCI